MKQVAHWVTDWTSWNLAHGTSSIVVCSLFEKRSPILNNFETFLEAFVEAYGEHDKAGWATIKIWSLQQGAGSASIYASDFRQLACDINWDEEALMSQLYWGLRDDVKDLLLSLFDPQMLNEAIS